MRMRMRTRAGYFIALMLLGSSLPLCAQQIQINKDNKTIAITTSDQAETLADTAVITVGFNIFGKDQDATYADASRMSNAIIAALTSAGVAKDAIESQAQALSRLNPGNDMTKDYYAQGLRFVFSQSWRVTVPAAAAAGILHVAITSGANESGNIDWQLKQDDALEAEAASKALEHARQIASRMAAGLGVKLGALVYASNQTPPRFGLYSGSGSVVLQSQASSIGMATKNLAPLAISPDKIQKTATVYAVFAIE